VEALARPVDLPRMVIPFDFMSDTPETDKLDNNMSGLSPDQGCDYRFMLRHARKMERERDEARKLTEDMRLTAEDCAAMPIVTSPFPWENMPQQPTTQQR